MADRRHLLTQPPKSKSDQTLLSLIAAAKMSEQERRLRDEIARGGQSLNMHFHDPLAGVTNQDPLEMATGIPTGGAQDFTQGAASGLMGASEYMTPAYLREGYQGPQTGLGPVGDALAGLGQVFQGGSAAGPMGGPSTLLAQYAGRLPSADNAFGTFMGVKAKKFPHDMLKVAEDMETAGRTPAQIHSATGLHRGAEGKWRAEISDDTARLGSAPNELSTLNSYPVGAVLRHPDLYDNYPELRAIKVRPEDGAGGGINLAENEMFLGTGRGIADAASRAQHVKGVALHELQHKIQELEGFAPGAGKETAARSLDDYARAAGEVEARNVQRRMDWTSSQRRGVLPLLSEDVPRSSQTIGRPSSAPLSGGTKIPRGLGSGLDKLTEAEDVASLRARMRIFEESPPVREMSPERIAQLRAEAEAARAKNQPKKYEVPPMEDFLPKDRLGKRLDRLIADESDAPRPTVTGSKKK